MVKKYCQGFDLIYVTYFGTRGFSFRPIMRKYRQCSTVFQESLQLNLQPLPFTVIIIPLHQTIKNGFSSTTSQSISYVHPSNCDELLPPPHFFHFLQFLQISSHDINVPCHSTILLTLYYIYLKLKILLSRDMTLPHQTISSRHFEAKKQAYHLSKALENHRTGWCTCRITFLTHVGNRNQCC